MQNDREFLSQLFDTYFSKETFLIGPSKMSIILDGDASAINIKGADNAMIDAIPVFAEMVTLCYLVFTTERQWRKENPSSKKDSDVPKILNENVERLEKILDQLNKIKPVDHKEHKELNKIQLEIIKYICADA